MRRAQLGQPTLARVDIECPKQGPDTDRTDDLVAGQPLDRRRDLVTDDEGGDLAFRNINERECLRTTCGERMHEHTPHRRQLPAVSGTLPLDALPMRFHRHRVGTRGRPPPHVPDAIAHGLPCGPDDVVRTVKFPESVLPYDDGAATPELR